MQIDRWDDMVYILSGRRQQVGHVVVGGMGALGGNIYKHEKGAHL